METALNLYAQLIENTPSQTFYLDDELIMETAPPPGGTPVMSWNPWSDGGLDGWTPFGSVTLTNALPSPQDLMGDAHALLTTGRTATYEGPSLNLLGVNGIVAGATYQISAYVMLQNADASNPTVTMSTKTTNCATSGAYANLATRARLSNTAWTKVSGTFTYSNLPGRLQPHALLPVQQRDRLVLHQRRGHRRSCRGRRRPPDQQDNTGITTNFADGLRTAGAAAQAARSAWSRRQPLTRPATPTRS